MLTVNLKVTGQTAAQPSFSVPLPPALDPDSDGVTLADLIALCVHEELAAAGERRSELVFVRALSESDIAAGQASGRYDSGGRETPPLPSKREAVSAALQAFKDELYFVVVDGKQQTDLDQVLTLRSDSNVTFIRLVALAGG